MNWNARISISNGQTFLNAFLWTPRCSVSKQISFTFTWTCCAKENHDLPRENPRYGEGDTASYPESSRKHDFKLISALISFALFSKYIYKSKPQFVFYVYFLFPVFVDLHSTVLTLTIIPSYQKIKYSCLVSPLYLLVPFGRGNRTEMFLFGPMR